MLFKFIFYLVVFYFIFKFVSRLFLPSGSQQKKKGGSFNINFGNFNRQNGSGPTNGQSTNRTKKNLDEIEEAEYEEIVEENKKSS